MQKLARIADLHYYLFMLFRAAICFIASTIALLFREYLHGIRLKNQRPPFAQNGFVLAALFIYRFSCFVGMAAIGLLFLPPSLDPLPGSLFVAACGLLGLWLGSIALQLEQNTLLRIQGRPTRRIRWARGVLRP
jgi:hypothetical protein